MTPSPDPAEALAREAVALYEGLPAPGSMHTYGEAFGMRMKLDAFKAHAWQHYATLARAYLAQSERLRAAEWLLREMTEAYAHERSTCPICKADHCETDGCGCRLAAFLACQPAREAT